LDLPTGYLILEETATDRSYDTWQELVQEQNFSVFYFQ
jgi:hypothetical protein